ncbi:ArsR family transcriptional regulator [Peptostreptococcus sp. MV1]|uniref:response regulator transcription factor n=1 Tax=Peptostreptococcus sp. MV1 TaxID=1219626 RepID=UPI00050FDB4E|nr:response regulator transcription factor [Peptostreptococcus sp. MV1]KGF10612.1 ArsR family transcriptional regulator [Peptostreptococcus sp. MV1]
MIYYVEDDKNIRDLVIYTLITAGMDAKGFEDSGELKKGIEDEIPDLILCDIMLPGQDGLTILGDIKSGRKTCDIPVVMITAKGSEYDKVIGLDSGADDYITKPFGMMELVSRVKAVLRRYKSSQKKDCLSIGTLTLDSKKHEVRIDGQYVYLTLKEFALLELMMKNKNIAFSRDVLLEKIWGYDFDGETRTVDVHIRTLRGKLGNMSKFIETVRGVGYRIGDKYE